MVLFLSTFINKIDKKGRVSVPASFRSALLKEDFPGIIAYGSFINGCVEACGISRIKRLSETIDELDPYSEVRDAFATTILGGCVQLPFDSEGRVIIPSDLLGVASLTTHACFVGKGATFEIWTPEIYNEYQKHAKGLARQERSSLQFRRPDGGGR
jgi:transcriptional regulator MraZ